MVIRVLAADGVCIELRAAQKDLEFIALCGPAHGT